MKKITIIVLIGVFLLTSTHKAFADGWETAGKILAGVVIGYTVSEAIKMPKDTRCVEVRPAYQEYRVWVPGYWQESYAYELVPGRYEKRLVRALDGSYYEIEEYIHPTTRPVSIREWIPGRWETRITRCR